MAECHHSLLRLLQRLYRAAYRSQIHQDADHAGRRQQGDHDNAVPGNPAFHLCDLFVSVLLHLLLQLISLRHRRLQPRRALGLNQLPGLLQVPRLQSGADISKGGFPVPHRIHIGLIQAVCPAV